MSEGRLLSLGVRELLERTTLGDRSAALCLLAICQRADASGSATLHDIAVAYREDHLEALRAEGRNAESEAGRLSVDEASDHLARVVLPRLVASGVVAPLPAVLDGTARIRLADALGAAHRETPAALERLVRITGEHRTIGRKTPAAAQLRVGGNSVLSVTGLVKTYRKRNVVNDVALQLRQGEIVGLLGPNGAGKTTTFYMIAGLIPPAAGVIRIDGEDITRMPMYKRARRGIGYLSQEPSIFRKLTVEENVLAILETLPLSRAARLARLEVLLDELSIKHLRANKAYSLSGGERRRLEITRALVTQPRFMMLDEPFAGVDPIAVHDIQGIVASLKDRGIGVLITDHNVRETLGICDRAYIISEGRVLAEGTPHEIVDNADVRKVYLGEHFRM